MAEEPQIKYCFYPWYKIKQTLNKLAENHVSR